MSFCDKCGAYVPMGETACPACGYDPEAEARRQESEEREAKEQARREAEAARQKAAEEARAAREQEQAQRRSKEQQQWQESAQRAREQAQRWAEEAKRQASTAQKRYSSQRGNNAGATQQQSWTPPWEAGTEAQSSRNAPDEYSNRMRSEAQDAMGKRKLSILSYLGFLFFIPLSLRNKDPFVRFHANQGLVLFLLEAVLSFFLGGSGILSMAGSVFTLVCIVRGIRSVLAGRMDKLPLIGDIRIIK